MRLTDFDDLLGQEGSAGVRGYEQVPAVVGTPVTAAEIKDRLSTRLYEQLADGSEDRVTIAMQRAVVRASAVYARLGRVLNLDVSIDREVAILLTIYELHLSLGNAEAGREYRIHAKDLIVATYGNYPEAEKPLEEKPALGALTVPKRKDWP